MYWKLIKLYEGTKFQYGIKLYVMNKEIVFDFIQYQSQQDKCSTMLLKC